MKLRDWHYQENQEMLAAIAGEGVDTSAPVEIINAFITDSQHQAEALAEMLLEHNFDDAYVSGEPDDDSDNEWLVDAVRTFVPTIEALNAMTDQCLEIATRTGVEYDGWYVELEGADDDFDDDKEDA